MRQEVNRLESAQAHAVAIFPMEAAALHGWFEGTGPRIRLAGDPRREVFDRYGVGRLPWRKLVTGRTLREGLRAGRETELPTRRGGDHLGRPALFVVDRAQRVRFAHFGSDVADRPDWERIFTALAGE